MARAGRAVIQTERLSTQVYQLLRDDLSSGEFAPGERLVELELAAKYGVSRTPVREALVQLSRDGLLVSEDRGYRTPSFSHADILNRLEVKRLLEPRVAEHAAADGKPEELKALAKMLDKEKAAHAAGKAAAFHLANKEARRIYRSMCGNELLTRCLLLVDNQFDPVRARIHNLAENREKTIHYDNLLYEALQARDPSRAAAAASSIVDFLQSYYAEHSPAEIG